MIICTAYILLGGIGSIFILIEVWGIQELRRATKKVRKFFYLLKLLLIISYLQWTLFLTNLDSTFRFHSFTYTHTCLCHNTVLLSFYYILLYTGQPYMSAGVNVAQIVCSLFISPCFFTGPYYS